MVIQSKLASSSLSLSFLFSSFIAWLAVGNLHLVSSLSVPALELRLHEGQDLVGFIHQGNPGPGSEAGLG